MTASIDIIRGQEAINVINKYALLLKHKEEIPVEIAKFCSEYNVMRKIPDLAIQALLEKALTPEEFIYKFS